MQFTQIPPQYAPLGSELRYVVEQETAADIDIRIYDENSGALYGAKRLTATVSADVDIAPVVRRNLQFSPTTGASGFHAAPDRTAAVRVEAGPAGSGSAEATAPARTFIPGEGPATTPAIRTSMPLERLIPEGACDELTLLTDGDCVVTVSGWSVGSATAESFREAGAGLHVFRLDTRDFPGCETLTVDAGACGTVTYTLIPAAQEALRIAWRSCAGSIEHYSFPVIRSTALRVAKQRAEGIDGLLVTAAESLRETVLESAYETPETLEALAGLLLSPEVWILRNGEYVPVDVRSEEAVIQRHGALCSLEIVVRPKNNPSWN